MQMYDFFEDYANRLPKTFVRLFDPLFLAFTIIS